MIGVDHSSGDVVWSEIYFVGGMMFRRILSLSALIMLVGAILYAASTSDDTLSIPFDELTFDCGPDEEFDGYIWDSAGDLKRAAGLTSVKRLARENDISAVYRFTWQRSFHWPYVMTLEISEDGTGWMQVLAWDGRIGGRQMRICEEETGVCEDPEPIKKQVDIVILLSAEEVSEFESLVVQFEFWELANFPCGIGGNDGAIWTLEGASGRDYQYVHRWSPRSSDSARELGEWFISATGLDLDPVY